MYIWMLVGLSPKFEMGCSEAPSAHAAVTMEPRMEDRMLWCVSGLVNS